jgi:hypothetical protein
MKPQRAQRGGKQKSHNLLTFDNFSVFSVVSFDNTIIYKRRISMDRQNVTLSLPKSLLKKAKIIAASKEKSLSEFLRESLEEKVRGANGYKKAKERQLKILKEGLNLGTKGHITIAREEVHGRR